MICPKCKKKVDKENTYVKVDNYVYCKCGYPLFNRLLVPEDHWCQKMEVK